MKIKRQIVESISFEDLQNACEELYDAGANARAFAEKFVELGCDSDDIAALWASCVPSEENPDGQVYDDEVYDAIYWFREDIRKEVFKEAKKFYKARYTPLPKFGKF